MTNSKVVGTTDCPLYEAIAFQMPKIAPKMVLVRRYPVTLISRGGLATGGASMGGCSVPGCEEESSCEEDPGKIQAVRKIRIVGPLATSEDVLAERGA
jgi:hypothetical protein